jgi:hypothetical protein
LPKTLDFMELVIPKAKSMLTTRELATILAALTFWSEEIISNGDDFARPYLESVDMVGFEPLTTDEIEGLSERLRKSQFSS